MDSLSNNPIVARIDERLKEIASNLEAQTDEIESLAAPYHQFEFSNQSRNE
jgi:NADH:ubiquinone oxidoreductase subunit E